MTRQRKRFVTRHDARSATFCRVQNPSTLEHRYERLRWARLRAGFERAKDAADSLGIKPGTYRTYERPPENAGREPELTELQRMARKFKVNWIWLATGDQAPEADPLNDDRLAAAAKKAAEVPADKQDDAWNAVMGVLDAFARKAG